MEAARPRVSVRDGSQRRSGCFRSDARGATMVEFALVGIIFFLSILALFDFVRYLIAQSVLKSAASRAVSQASVIPNLDADCPSLPSASQATCPQNRAQALEQVFKTLVTLPSETMVSSTPGQGGMQYFINGTDAAPAAEIILSSNEDYRAYYTNGSHTSTMKKSSSLSALDSISSAASRPSLKTVLQTEPIQVKLRAQFKPVLKFLGTFPLEVTAAGFREIQGVPSFPAKVDCHGTEIVIGQSGNNTNCPCESNPGNPLLIQGTSGCICVNNQMTTVVDPSGAVVNCACPTPKVASGDNCVCPALNCPAGTVVDNSTCSCVCPNNQVSNGSSGCTCTPPLVVSGDQCVCPSDPGCAAAGGYQDSSTCQCKCPDSMQFDSSGKNCVCKPVSCTGGTIDSNCNCNCPNGNYLINGKCQCPSPHVVLSGQCKCPTVSCTGGYVNDSTCQCECPGSKVLSGGSCKCPTNTCQGGTIDSNCNCACPNKMTQVNGVCVCSGGSVASGSGCSCPGSSTWNGSKCTCPYNQQLINNTCRCPNNSVMLSTGFCFVPE